MEQTRVGLIYGGRSGEHEVSLLTALACLQAMDTDKYEIFLYYITTKGLWVTCDPFLELPQDVDGLRLDKQATGMKSGSAAIAGFFEEKPAVDIAMLLLHGTYGEDGTVQGLFEMANIPYAGCGVLASATGMDKVIMKQLFAHAGLPQGAYVAMKQEQWDVDVEGWVQRVESALGYPCFVKPANSGSSVGIRKAKNAEQLVDAVAFAFRYDRKVLVEAFIDGREVEVAVLGNAEPQVSVAGEIVPSNEFYDYQAKYLDGSSKLIIPAEISQEQQFQLADLAIQAFQTIDGSGLARVDFFLCADGTLLINEINTMPGFTPHSMYPMLWQKSGLPYSDLLTRLLDLGFERYAERQRLDTVLDSSGADA